MQTYYAETPVERVQLFRKYVLGIPEPMHSSFVDSEMPTWLLRLFAQVQRIPKEEVSHLLANTYSGYLSNRKNPNWRADIEYQIGNLLEVYISHNLIDEENGNLSLSALGRACGQSTLGFDSILRLIETVKSINGLKLEAKDLMVVIQTLPEFDERYTPIGRVETGWINKSKYGSHLSPILGRFAKDTLTHSARCKRACVLIDWINGQPLDAIVKEYSSNTFAQFLLGDMRGLADMTRFHLISAYEIVSCILGENSPSEELINELLNQLEAGIPVDTLELMKIPVQLERGEYFALRDAGIKTTEAVWLASKEKLVEILGNDRGEIIERLRPLK